MHRNCAGFTLVELIFVIVLTGILSTYAVTQWPDDGDLTLPSQSRLFVTHVRHTQSLAMQWGQPLSLSVAAGSYSVSCVTASATAPCNSSPVIDPATGSAFSVTLESGLSLSGVASASFDALGRPFSGATLLSSSPARSYTMSAGADNIVITIHPITGFVETSP